MSKLSKPVSTKAKCYQRKRDALRLELGNKCAKCRRKRGLHFDCKVPQADGHARRKSSVQRMRYYLRQHQAGNLQLLCEFHNCQKGATTDKQFIQSQRNK